MCSTTISPFIQQYVTRESYLKWVGFSFQLNHNRGIHAATPNMKLTVSTILLNQPDFEMKLSYKPVYWSKPNLQRTSAQYSSTLILCHVFWCFSRSFNRFLLFRILGFNGIPNCIFIVIIINLLICSFLSKNSTCIKIVRNI